MYQLTVSFNTEEELLAYIEMRAQQVVAAAGGTTEKPATTRKRKGTTTTETSPAAAPTAAAPAAVDPMNVLGLPSAGVPSGDPLASLGNSAAQLPPVATPAPIPAAAPAPVVAPAGPSQQDVIKAFVALGQKPGKGIDAVKALLVPYGVTTVTAIKPEHFAHAIQAATQAFNS